MLFDKCNWKNNSSFKMCFYSIMLVDIILVCVWLNAWDSIHFEHRVLCIVKGKVLVGLSNPYFMKVNTLSLLRVCVCARMCEQSWAEHFQFLSTTSGCCRREDNACPFYAALPVELEQLHFCFPHLLHNAVSEPPECVLSKNKLGLFLTRIVCVYPIRHTYWYIDTAVLWK